MLLQVHFDDINHVCFMCVAVRSQFVFANTDVAIFIGPTMQALVELSETNIVWPGDCVDDRLRNAHAQFTKLCRQYKIRVSAAFRCGQLFDTRSIV